MTERDLEFTRPSGEWLLETNRTTPGRGEDMQGKRSGEGGFGYFLVTKRRYVGWREALKLLGQHFVVVKRTPNTFLLTW